MENTEHDNQQFQTLQSQAKSLGVSVVEMLLTRSELYWAIMSNGPRRAKYITEE